MSERAELYGKVAEILSRDVQIGVDTGMSRMEQANRAALAALKELAQGEHTHECQCCQHFFTMLEGTNCDNCDRGPELHPVPSADCIEKRRECAEAIEKASGRRE